MIMKYDLGFVILHIYDTYGLGLHTIICSHVIKYLIDYKFIFNKIGIFHR